MTSSTPSYQKWKSVLLFLIIVTYTNEKRENYSDLKCQLKFCRRSTFSNHVSHNLFPKFEVCTRKRQHYDYNLNSANFF